MTQGKDTEKGRTEGTQGRCAGKERREGTQGRGAGKERREGTQNGRRRGIESWDKEERRLYISQHIYYFSLKGCIAKGPNLICASLGFSFLFPRQPIITAPAYYYSHGSFDSFIYRKPCLRCFGNQRPMGVLLK